ncbi:BcNRPS3, nonribosomal peptide synthetase [Tricladium varicosporioides]|nr:BcNRPS3, nonribosomal peptide synthetase [Hymenoscyphus varicosporioides]
MQSINNPTIISPTSLVRETRFPFLDTIYRPRAASNQPYTASSCLTHVDDIKNFRYKIEHLVTRLPSSSIYESYAKFILNFTGYEEISFSATSTEFKGNTVISARKVECGVNGTPVSLEIAQLGTLDVSLDFGLSVLDIDGVNGATLPNRHVNGSGTFVIIVHTDVAGDITEVALKTKPHILSEEDAIHLFNSFLFDILPGRQETILAESVLNFPPISHPPTLPQDDDSQESHDHVALLHDAFGRRAKQYPDRIAIDFLKNNTSSQQHAVHQTFTYSELDDLTNHLAQKINETLCTGAIRTSSVVPVLLSTSPELYISYLAVLKAGLAFCPLPVDAPPQRILDILEDLSPQIILGAEAFRERLTSSRFPADNVDSPSQWIWLDVEKFVTRYLEPLNSHDTTPLSIPLPLVEEDDVCYIMYTSGSTGKPKGVQITHLAASCSIASHSLASELPPSTDGIPRWFQFAAPTFDPSLMEIFVTLSTGATLCSSTREMALTDLEEVISELRASIMMSTPSMAATMRRAKLPSLKSLWTMGETVLRKNINDFAREDTSSELCNAYGPTEASINCTLLPNFHPGDRGSIIGPALPTCSLFVIDPENETPTLVPRGFAGELAIGGPQVSVGYLNRPEQNAKSFVLNPKYGRLYRTGDQARVVTDRKGNHVVEFLGRLDTTQVKLSGRRVDLAEIDTIISACVGVKEAVTVACKRYEDQNGSEEVVAFMVIETLLEKAAIESACQTNSFHHLPPYMCPSTYHFLDKIPRSLTGKVDRKALLSLARGFMSVSSTRSSEISSDLSETLLSVNSDIEYGLRKILASVTGQDISNLNHDTNFFSIGVDSLRAVRFLQQAREIGVLELKVADVLQGGSTRSLAHVVMERRASTRPTDSISQSSSMNSDNPCHWAEFTGQKYFVQKYRTICSQRFGIPEEEFENILPTTATQSGMLASFLRSSSAAVSSGKHYIHHSVHHINSNIDIGKLQKAWAAALSRHDAYRMVFLPVDDQISPFMQCILNAESNLAKVLWEEVFLNDNSKTRHESAVQTALAKAENDIGLERPPYRLALVTGLEGSTIIFSLLHPIFDGASLQLLFEEVSAEYQGSSVSPRTEIQTAVDMHFKTDQKCTIEYWSKLLQECDPAPFPSLSGIRGELITKRPGTTTILAATDIDSLRVGATKSLASPLAILQAAWSIILVAYKDSWASATFGSVISGRLDQETEYCMGPTFTTIPVFISALNVKSATNATILQHLTASNAKALSHLQIPLNSLVTSNGTLHYDTLLAFQDFATPPGTSDLWHTVDYPAMGNDFAVMIEVRPELDGKLRLRATYTNEFLDNASATLMLKEFSDIIACISLSPEKPYSDCRFLSTRSQSMPCEALDTMTDVEELLHGPFESNAKLYPGDVALEFVQDLESQAASALTQWTYGELNDKSNHLASVLVRKLGSLKDKIITFCLDKSPELYVAILAILKAGAAWCPIDPSFPATRRYELIARTDTRILLVSGNTVLQSEESVPIGVEILNIGDMQSNIAFGMTHFNLDSRIVPHPKDMAYLIWTSGTTGFPKGVQVQHNSASRAMRSLQNLIPRSKKNQLRCLQFSQPTFDVFVQDLFFTWGLRGTVISAPKDIMLGSFAALSNQTKATHAHLTPAFSKVIPRKTIETLEVVTMIGEALAQTVADDWGHDMKAFNTYGPAEVSVVSTVRQFGGCLNKFQSMNVGFTLPSVTAFVISDNRVIMRGGVGELALAGPQVARGYWKDSLKTAEKFLWNESTNCHVYMTGDIVRQLHDGSFEFVGRRDDLVKLAGQRVELSEISFTIERQLHEVEQAVTMYIGHPDRPAKVIVVFLSAPQLISPASKGCVPIISSEAAIISNEAAAIARESLPDYMVPSIFIVLGKIPVTASTKIDRKQLERAYELLNLETWGSKVSPTHSHEWTEHEQGLVHLISKFSGTAFDTIGRLNRLAALGIDSIGAIRLTERLKLAGYDISMVDLLHSRTVEDLCILSGRPHGAKQHGKGLNSLQLFHQKYAVKVSKIILSPQLGSFSVRPTLPLQDNLLSESFRNSLSYWSNHFFDLDDGINLERLHEAWYAIATANEALRTGFLPAATIIGDQSENSDDKIASAFVQVVYDEATVDWAYQKINFGQLKDVAQSKVQAITSKHQESAFLNPCWAVTIFEDEGGRRTMIFTVHHSLHDGPSLDFIFKDLKDAYASNCTLKSRHQLNEAVAISLASKTSIGEDDAFWKSVLKDFIANEEIDTPDSKVAGQSPRYNTIRMPLSIPYSKLQQAAYSLNCRSATSILRLAWASIVADYMETDTKNIVLGEVISERVVDSSLENVIGPLICLMPAPVYGTGSTREIAQKHDQAMISGWKHRNVSPGFIRRLIGRPKTQALYPAVFVFHPWSASSDEESSLWRATEDIIGLNVEHDYTLNVFQTVDGDIDLEVSVEAQVLPQPTVKLLSKQLDALVAAMVASPDKPIAQLTNSFPSELISMTKPRFLEMSNVVSIDNPLCWFEHWAENHPNWPAAEIVKQLEPENTKTVSWSYGRLNEEAGYVKGFIEQHGIKARMIGMCLGRTLEAFAITLGILKSGNVYLPIDEDLPEERKAFLLQDSDAAIFFTSGSNAFTPKNCRFINVETEQYRLKLQSPGPSRGSKDDPAYLLYTSGSTGTPKGCLISRGNLTSFCEAQSEFICSYSSATRQLGGTGKYLGLASRAFDVHVGEMFLAWRHGLCCTTASRSLLLDDLPLALKDLKITHASFVPSLLDQVGLVPEDVPLLKYLGVGGEKISQRTLESFGDSSSVVLINAYGPTEATIGCCSSRATSKSNMRSIGKPLGDTTAHVLLPGTLIYAKRGMEGELCLTGSLVGIGYHNRDTGAFIENFNGQKMYRTGDLVRMLPDDTIEIFGRSDDQTKIRGQRLELGEVSECVRLVCSGSPDVTSLIAKHPSLSRMQLVSFVAYSKSRNGAEMPEVLRNFNEINATVRSGCMERLPAYMVPDIVVPITFLPLAATSGKANVKMLKSIFDKIPLQWLLSSGGSTSKEENANRELNKAEELVAGILTHLTCCNLSDIRPSTNIFEIGVDSLVAISLSTLMRKNGYDCSVASILGLSTVAELTLLPRTTISSDDTAAKKAVATAKLAAVESTFHVSPIGVRFRTRAEAARPSLPIQEAVVARSLDKYVRTLYVNHVILELAKQVDTDKLKKCWRSSIDENEILRTCFCQVHDDILQVVLRSESVELLWNEHVLPTSEPECVLKDMQFDVAKHIVDNIQDVPPLRFNLVKSENTKGRTLLYISLHHALYDAESLSLLVEDLYSRYMNLTLPIRPAASALIEHVATTDQKEAQDFWTKVLGDHRIVAQQKSISSSEEAKISVRALKVSLSSLEASAAKLHVTLPSLAQLAFGLAMAKVDSINDFVFGLVLSGRSVPVTGIEKLMAPSITTIPQRVDLRNGSSRISDVLSKLQKASAQMIQFQHTSLRSIHKWVKADRPLFNCLFSYVKHGKQPDYHNLWKEIESYMPPDYPLAVEFEARSTSNYLVIRAGYTPEFGTTTHVDNLLESIESLIEAIVTNDKLTVKDLGITTVDSSISAEPQKATASSDAFLEQELKIKDVLVELGDFSSVNISRNSTFFRLGVDSVIAIRFARKLREAGFEVSSSDISQHPSIALLSEAISNKAETATAVVVPDRASDRSLIDRYRSLITSLGPGDYISSIYYCTPLQSGLLTQTIANGGRLYVHHPTVRLDRSIDLERLKNAWTATVRSLDILRTSFHYVESKEVSWVAAVHENPIIDFIELDLETNVEERIEHILGNMTFESPATFSKTPLKVTISKGQSANFMTISLHHSLYDGWSLPLIFNTLSTMYSNNSLQSPQLRPDFSEAAVMIHENQKASDDFWYNKIKEYESTPIPSSLCGMDKTAFMQIQLKIPTSEALQKSQALDINLQSAALLAHGKALCCVVRQGDIVFGHVVSGRSLALGNSDQIVGPLFNTVPFRIRLNDQPRSNAEAVKEVQEIVVCGQRYQHASLNAIQRRWRQGRMGSDAALLDSLFVFQKGAEESESAENQMWESVKLSDDRDATEYGLNVEFVQGSDTLWLSVSSPPGRLSAEDLMFFCQSFNDIFSDILKNPDCRDTRYPKAFQDLPTLAAPPERTLVKTDDGFEDVVNHPAFEVLLASFSNVSNIISEKIELQTSIFALGIDSITAIRVASICRQNGVRLSVADVLKGRSVGGILRLLKFKSDTVAASENKARELSTAVINAVIKHTQYVSSAVEEVLPCMAGQAYHLASWLKSGRTTYEPVWALRSSSRLDVDKISQIWQTLQRKYPILRTVFASLGGSKTYQIVLSTSSISGQSIPRIKSSGSLEDNVKFNVRQLSQTASTLFKPPASLHIVQGETDDAVLIRLHHSLYDAWTMRSLIEEISSLYHGETVPDVPQSFPAFVKKIENGADMCTAEAYWKNTLLRAQKTIIDASRDISMPSLNNLQQQTFVWVKPGVPNLAQLNKQCQGRRTALSTVILLAFATVLGRRTNTTNPTFGFFQTGRSAVDAGSVAGPCVNLLPMTVDVSNARDGTILQLIKSIQDGMTTGLQFEQSHLRDVLAWASGLQPSLESTKPEPLFNASLNLLWHAPPNISVSAPNPFLRVMDIGVPSDFAATEPILGETAVDKLETGYLAERNLFVDVGPVWETDSVDFGVKVDACLMNEEEVKVFVGNIVESIEMIMRALE